MTKSQLKSVTPKQLFPDEPFTAPNGQKRIWIFYDDGNCHELIGISYFSSEKEATVSIMHPDDSLLEAVIQSLKEIYPQYHWEKVR